jgi:hypothetical protein
VGDGVGNIFLPHGKRAHLAFLTLDTLTKDNVSREFSNQAKQAVNSSLTIPNWCIAGYIHEYELNGSDRA